MILVTFFPDVQGYSVRLLFRSQQVDIVSEEEFSCPGSRCAPGGDEVSGTVIWRPLWLHQFVNQTFVFAAANVGKGFAGRVHRRLSIQINWHLRLCGNCLMSSISTSTNVNRSTIRKTQEIIDSPLIRAPVFQRICWRT